MVHAVVTYNGNTTTSLRPLHSICHHATGKICLKLNMTSNYLQVII